MSIIGTLATLVILESIALCIVIILTCQGYKNWFKVALVRIRGKKYIFKLNRDNVMTIEGADEVEGCYKTPNGVYELEPDDALIFNGCAGGIWYAPYNRAVSARVLPLLRDLKKAGIENYTQLMYYYSTPIEKIRAESGDSAAQIAEIIQSYDGKILQDLEIVRISDLKNFLESRSPAAENGIIERYINIERRKLGNPLKNGNMVMMLIMAALLGLAFGFILAGGTGGGGIEVPAGVTAASGLTQIR